MSCVTVVVPTSEARKSMPAPSGLAIHGLLHANLVLVDVAVSYTALSTISIRTASRIQADPSKIQQ